MGHSEVHKNQYEKDVGPQNLLEGQVGHSEAHKNQPEEEEVGQREAQEKHQNSLLLASSNRRNKSCHKKNADVIKLKTMHENKFKRNKCILSILLLRLCLDAEKEKQSSRTSILWQVKVTALGASNLS